MTLIVALANSASSILLVDPPGRKISLHGY